MITSKTPYRVSFFGGGTDYEGWYKENGGSFISMAINKYCYLNVRYLPPFFDYKSRIVWSKIEHVNDISEIQHPAIRVALETEGLDAIELHHIGDLPARSGLGSSSSFSVGILKALRDLKGEKTDKYSLARDAINLERVLLKEAGGIQDQIAAAYGGFNHVEIFKNGDFRVENLMLDKEKSHSLESSLLLVFTGIFRNSYEIAEQQSQNILKNSDQINMISGLTSQARKILLQSDFVRDFGELLSETWHAKKLLDPSISNPVIDEIYNTAILSGAFGGKLLGAGAGGFMIFVVPCGKMKDVKDSLSRLIQVSIEIDHVGTQVFREFYTEGDL